MNNNSNHSSKLHPMILAAAGAVIVVSGVGVAAILGWLPSSDSKNQDPALATNAPAVEQAGTPLAPVAPPVAPVAEPAKPSPEPVRQAVREPVRQAPPPVRETVREPVREVAAKPKPAPAICNNCGVISSINVIDQRAEGSGLGAAGGAIVGGLLGNQVGGGNGRKLATVAGAVGGALAGNQIEGHVKATRSYDISVRLENGDTRTIHQAEQPAFRVGDRVRIVNGSLRSDD